MCTCNDTCNDTRNDTRDDTCDDTRDDTCNDTRNDTRNDTCNDKCNDTRNDTCNDTRNDTCTTSQPDMYPWYAKPMLLPTAVCEKKKTSNLLLVKCGLKRLGLSSLGQQAGVAFQQAGVAFPQAGVAFQQAGVAIQHLLPNQESLCQCSQAVSRSDTDDKQTADRHKQHLHACQQKHELVCCSQKKKDSCHMRPTCAHQWTHAECAHASITMIIIATLSSS